MSKPAQMSQSYVMSDNAVRFATKIMAGQGVSNEDAAIIAECLVEADLRGVQTHGLSRLPVYVERVQRGLVKAVPEMKLETSGGLCVA